MRLKSLDIVGFKSFADPFRIDFREGISSIVGPNGCGKSNVADAIRWVLGTQSPKQLRAEKMESVIFSGSVKRKQLGMAEVTLTFDNSDRSLNLDYDEVSVSRRLFRSGESEYSINGARCRLMDITDLVVDRGLGATGYWILEAKMVETILSNRPEDRRFLFDEAAGIVKYKIQRHRAELKLESAASDLERLTDIIAEVETTCRGLKRQVSAFRKHEKITGSIRSIKEARSLLESTQLTRKLEEYNAELDRSGAEVGELTALLSASSTSLEGLRTEFGLVQGQLDQAHRDCSELDNRLARGERESAVTGEKVDSAERRISENRARIAGELERVELYRRDLKTLEEERVSLAPEISDLEARTRGLESGLEEKKGRVTLAEEELRTVRDSRLSLEKQMDQLREENLKRVQEREARKQRIALLEERLAEGGRTVTLLENARLEIRDGIDGVTRGLQTERERGTELDLRLEKLQEAMKGLAGQESRISDSLAVAREKERRTLRLMEKLAGENTLSSMIEPAEGMGTAIGSFLSGYDRAEPVDSIPGGEPAEGDLYIVETGAEPASKLPAGAVPLSSCVASCSNPVLRGVLGRGILAPDLDTGLRWVREGLRFTVVTPRGDIIRPEGFARAGIAEESAGALELADMLEGCRKEVAGVQADLEGKREELQGAEGTIAETVRLREENRRTVSGLERELAGLEATLAGNGAEAEKLRSAVAGMEEDLRELRDEKGPASDDSREIMDDMKARKEELAAAESRCSSNLSSLESQLTAAVRELDTCSFTLREKLHRREETAQRMEMLTREMDRIDELVNGLGRSNEEALGLIGEMKEKLEEIRRSALELQKERESAEELRTGLSARRNQLMERSALLEKEVQETREKLNRSKARMIETEASAAGLRSRLKEIQETIDTRENPYLHLGSEELDRKLESEQAALERLGPVNMLAVGEYEENSKRLDYLKEQKQDLEDARESLSRAIGEINREAARRFKETFEQVREHFNDMFVKLFGGGEGDIISIEGDDPLEGGIEIMARPQGKKLKNVIALSAGEKAMTAVALLFSLYLVKPSPFCVLDELDGPFDDSNTDKFISILREFSSDTQFIVITHNKRTMEGSDILYGITMAEEGVSSITSVSLEEMAER